MWRSGSIAGRGAIDRFNNRRMHNRANAALAATMAAALGADESAICRALKTFTGLPHRLQFVAEIEGRAFFNDSKSTTPAATIAALATMNRPTWLLLGSADTQADWIELATAVVRQTKGAAVFGAVAEKLESCLGEIDPSFNLLRGKSMAAAFAWCWRQSEPGDAILLSPACPSTDQFRDFAHRGEEFHRLIDALNSPRRH